MDYIHLIFLAIGLSLAMAISWAVQRATGASGWIDTIWSLAVGVGGVAGAYLAAGPVERRVTAIVIVAAWSLRLAFHIGARTRLGGEDPRYEKLIKEWGDRASFRLFYFLQIQAVAAFILVLAVYCAASNPAEYPQVGDLLALAVAAVAVIGEMVADVQLSRFRKTPEAKREICQRGLWAYSRHPNYFFEWLFWCSWPLMALPALGFAAIALLAPVMMYWLLVHVSGIPPLEEHMLKSRGDQFRAVQARVNAFFPGPRRSKLSTQ